MKSTKYINTFGLAFYFLLLCSCNYHIVDKHSKLSHNFTTISFNERPSYYKTSEHVGGEQINSTIILAEAGKDYIVEVITDNENLEMHIDGKNIEIKYSGNKYNRTIHSLETTPVEISFTSYPDPSSYKLIIKNYHSDLMVL